jgi:hypothetical protein
LVNDRLEESTDQLVGIVQGERVRRSGKTPSSDEQHYLETARKCLKANMEGKIRDILASFDVVNPTPISTER